MRKADGVFSHNLSVSSINTALNQATSVQISSFLAIGDYIIIELEFKYNTEKEQFVSILLLTIAHFVSLNI